MGCSNEEYKRYFTNAFQKFLDESDGKANNIWAIKVVISTIDQ